MIEIVERLHKKTCSFYGCRITVNCIGRPVLPIMHTPSLAGGAGARPYDMSPCALSGGIKAGIFKVV